MSTVPSVPPAKRLLGLELQDGWTVTREMPLPPKATGGHFSTGYPVTRRDGTHGFLKALDYSLAFNFPPNEIALKLQEITEAINFERSLLKTCGDKNLDRIVRAVSSGTIRLNSTAPTDVVEYLIFELADADARHQMDSVRKVELAWIFRTLHHIATGLRQLHLQEIAHQDLKPSNVLVFKEAEGRKLADLGRAWRAGENPPHNSFVVAGDKTYAPPELLYGFVPSSERARRFGCDLYHLGSMVMYFFSGIGTTGAMVSMLHPQFWPGHWTGTFDQVLPYLQDAFGKVLGDFSAAVDTPFQEELTQTLKHLCSPDPAMRGHPKNRGRLVDQYSLERYISQFDRLAVRATYHKR